MLLFHPSLIQEARADAVSDVRSKLGGTRLRAARLLGSLDDERVTTETLDAQPDTDPSKYGPCLLTVSESDYGLGKIGDGTILKAIKDFLAANPEIKAFIIEAIKAALLALLGL